jgi:hypothetical protein
MAGITTMEAANRYLEEVYRPAFNIELRQPAMEEGSAFVAFLGGALDDILCEQFERTVGHDNCIRFPGPGAANPGGPAPLPLRQGEGAGPSLCGWKLGHFSWPA